MSYGGEAESPDTESATESANTPLTSAPAQGELAMLHTVLLVFALVLFMLAAFEVPSARVNLIAAGLACYIGSLLF